jgi:hypothetical protein
MKKIVFLFALAACIAACGPSKYVKENDSVDIGYGVQSKDHLTTSVSNVRSRSTSRRLTPTCMITCADGCLACR